VRDGARALRLVQSVVRKTPSPTPEMLDLLAAALAETRGFDEAEDAAARAAALARSQGRGDLANTIEMRRELYEAKTPYRMSMPRRSR